MIKKMKKIFISLLGTLTGLVLTFGAAACGGTHTEHTYGAWTTVEATCEGEGSRTRTCTICGEKDTETIPPLGHDYDLGTVTVKAGCETEGMRTRTCRRCQSSKEEEIAPLGHDWAEGEVLAEPACETPGRGNFTCLRCGKSEEHAIPALAHVWEKAGVNEEATCESAGTRNMRCALCGKTETDTIPAKGHTWEERDVVKAADCTNAGTVRRVCTVCGKDETVSVPALGHKWEGEYTVDREATFDRAGEKSYHCLRCGERNDVTEIPQLQEGVPILYEITLLRNNGERLTAPGAVVTVYNADGTVAAQSNAATLSAGVYSVNLSPATYTVKLTGLPAGYTAEGEVTVRPGSPFCALYLRGSVLKEEVPRATQYGVGSVMYDFTLHAVSGATYTLSELLTQKKAVVLNFWYDGCAPCRQEFPLLERAYQKYRDEIEVLAITEDPDDNAAAVRAYATLMGLTFPMVPQEERIGLESLFGVSNVPTTVVVDSEGVVCEIRSGSQSEFESLFEKYTSADYWTHGHAPAQTALTGEYALPDRKD